MQKIIKSRVYTIILFSFIALSDSFNYSNANNFGQLGLINTPSARFLDSPSWSFTAYKGDPDSRLVATFYPYDWLEGSIFYSSIEGKEYGQYSQDYKDKGFNLKIRIKDEGVFPAIAIGFNDLAGTGYYSSEFIVATYGIDNLDINIGMGWGNLAGGKTFKNPFTYLDKSFKNRPVILEDKGGQIQLDRYFSGEKTSIFGGINYVINDKLNFLAEYDSTLTPGKVGYEESRKNISYSLNYKLSNNLSIGATHERGNYFGIRFNYKDTKKKTKNNFKKPKKKSADSYRNLINILRENNIGVSSVSKNEEKLILNLTQYKYSNFKEVEDIVNKSINYSDIEEEVVTSYKVAGLKVIDAKKDQNFQNEIYKQKYSGVNNGLSLRLRPFIASREEFFKAAILLEHDMEVIFSENFFFSTNMKISLLDNFDDLIYPPENTYPNQVRSDIKLYLNNLGEKPSIGRAQFEYFKTLKKNNHFLFSAGIYEDMFSGFGMEFLKFNPKSKFSWGFEAHQAYKRDYDFQFGLSGYDNLTYFLNLFYQNPSLIPFDLKISAGEYLAGDKGTTFEFSRSFQGGIRMGAFFSFTDVTTEQFGEGSFDKGIFFSIPIGKSNRIRSFQWRPLTKDPAAKLIRKNDIYSLVKRFSYIN
tara:strand:+ start:15959 stop:17881 length:1923 start_codon:yes stop_codon:yes gene_type:complete